MKHHQRIHGKIHGFKTTNLKLFVIITQSSNHTCQIGPSLPEQNTAQHINAIEYVCVCSHRRYLKRRTQSPQIHTDMRP